MESNIQFVTELDIFLQMVLVTINSENNYQILISGTFDHPLFKKIIEKLLMSGKINKCKILIPHVGSTGIISRDYINKISNSGGKIRMNSVFRKNLIVVGNEAFIISLSSRYKSGLVVKSKFDCVVQTNDSKTVSLISEIFEKVWNKSLPIVNA
ncbi:hypothetical protein [Clostridium sp.]|uniref:hypothetical protein n=1 Tax=Clostridium sp. TaxID=1506 RepID=UPI001A546AC0|nr:hypothetical protein [Clostridium sp.]MBK5234693.1 hypothetical protein [Clostridium sp.]